jgi:hypothetical protein
MSVENLVSPLWQVQPVGTVLNFLGGLYLRLNSRQRSDSMWQRYEAIRRSDTEMATSPTILAVHEGQSRASTCGIDDFPSDPLGVVRGKPSDDSGGIRRLSPPPLWFER